MSLFGNWLAAQIKCQAWKTIAIKGFFLFVFFLNCAYVMCICGECEDTRVEVRVELCGIPSLPSLYVDSKNPAQMVRLYCKRFTF